MSDRDLDNLFREGLATEAFVPSDAALGEAMNLLDIRAKNQRRKRFAYWSSAVVAALLLGWGLWPSTSPQYHPRLQAGLPAAQEENPGLNDPAADGANTTKTPSLSTTQASSTSDPTNNNAITTTAEESTAAVTNTTSNEEATENTLATINANADIGSQGENEGQQQGDNPRSFATTNAGTEPGGTLESVGTTQDDTTYEGGEDNGIVASVSASNGANTSDGNSAPAGGKNEAPENNNAPVDGASNADGGSNVAPAGSAVRETVNPLAFMPLNLPAVPRSTSVALADANTELLPPMPLLAWPTAEKDRTELSSIELENPRPSRHSWYMLAGLPLSEAQAGGNEQSFSPTPRPTVGLGYQWRFARRFSIQANGLLQLTSGFDQSRSFVSESYGFGLSRQTTLVETRSMLYTQLPVLLHYHRGQHGFYLGAQGAFLLNTLSTVQQTDEPYGQAATNEENSRWGYLNGFDRWDAAWVAGYQLAFSSRFTLDLRYNGGVLDATRNDYFGQSTNDYHRRWQLLVHYRFSRW